MELLYRISAHRNIATYKKKANMKTYGSKSSLTWNMSTGEIILISNMAGHHLRNSIGLLERKFNSLKPEFDKILDKYGYEDIYLLNFKPTQAERKDLEKVFMYHPVYFYMRREELYRMHSLQRKIFKYTERRKIDYYGTN